MASLMMGSNAFDFKEKVIDENVPDDAIGNYALGYVNENTNVFIVLYVGRSDSNLKNRLKNHIGENNNFKQFKYIIQKTAKDAFVLECKNFHDFGGLDGKLLNKNHPDSPSGFALSCPYCKADEYFNSFKK